MKTEQTPKADLIPCQVEILKQEFTHPIRLEAFTIPTAAKDGQSIHVSDSYENMKKWLTDNGYKIIHVY